MMEVTKTRFEKYPAYKDSGVEWLGEIPEGWQVNRIKSSISLLTGYPFKSEKYSNTGVKLARGINVKEGCFDWTDKRCWPEVSKELESFLLEEGDVLIAMDGSKVGKNFCQVKQADLPILLLQRVARLRTRNSLLSKYLYWNIVSKSFLSWVNISKTDPMVPHIAPKDINNFVIALPSPAEQTAIANFLDDKTAKIDRVIAQKQQMIALLKERKQIIIQNAVTGKTNCLNHDSNDEHENYDSSKIKVHHKISNNHNSRPMKDSGVEWIGEIPEGWESTRLGYHMDILSGYAFPSNGFSNEGVKLLRGINVGVDSIRWNETVFWPKTKIKGLESYFLKVGDIVVGMDRPLIGKGMRVSIVQEQDLPCMLLQRVTRLKAINNLSQFFLGLLLQNQDFVNYFLPILSGVSVPHISPSQIQDYPIVLPSKTEQEHIVSFVIEQSTKIDQAISLQQTQIEKLKEYKATLIDSAVTGKIKVG